MLRSGEKMSFEERKEYCAEMKKNYEANKKVLEEISKIKGNKQSNGSLITTTFNGMFIDLNIPTAEKILLSEQQKIKIEYESVKNGK